jgi:hypothetical protein
MAKLLTREELEMLHDEMRSNFSWASSSMECTQRQVTARATAALALLEADQRLREVMEEDAGKTKRVAVLPSAKQG